MTGLGDLGSDGAGRGQQAGGARGHGLAQARVHLPLLGPLQQRAVHEHRAAQHRVARVDVLADRMLQEALGGDDLHPGRHLAVLEQAQHPAVVVDMGVREDHRTDRALLVPELPVLPVELPGGCRALLADQRVDHHDLGGHPGGVLQEGDVRQVHPAHLVHGVRDDLEQAGLHVQQGVAPQARVDRVRRRSGQKRVGGQAPGGARAARPVNREIRRQRRDQPLRGERRLRVLIIRRHHHRRVQIPRQRCRGLGGIGRQTSQRTLLPPGRAHPETSTEQTPRTVPGVSRELEQIGRAHV